MEDGGRGLLWSNQKISSEIIYNCMKLSKNMFLRQNSETSTFYIAKFCIGKMDPQKFPPDASSIKFNTSNSISHTNVMKVQNLVSRNDIFFHSIKNYLETIQGS